MQQVYHPNAVTNVHIRRQIKESSLTVESTGKCEFTLNVCKTHFLVN
jgi:hypothetical protein